MKFPSLIAVTSALAVMTTAAYAADSIGAEQPIAGYDWSGTYLGIQAGGAWAKADDSLVHVRLNGGALGGYAGANWQSGNLVFGIEADAVHSWNDGEIFGVNIGTDWQASLRGRLGYAMDRALIYGAGGIAISRVAVDASPAFVVKDTFTGWTLGGGVEYALSQNWTTRVDYRYSDYGSSGFGLGIGEVKLTEHALRFGVGYKF